MKIKTILNDIIIGINLVIVTIFFSINYGEFSIPCNCVLFNLFILINVFSIIFLLTGSLYKTIKINFFIDCIYLLINHVKILSNGDFFLLSDLKLFINSISIIELARGELIKINTYIPLIPIFVLGILNFVLLKENDEGNIKIHISYKYKIIILLFPIVILGILITPIRAKDEFILNKIYKMSNIKDYAAITTNYGYVMTQGIIGRNYTDILQNRIYPSMKYNIKNVEEVLNNSKTCNSKIYRKPNIIVVFSESFWDINKINEVKFSKNPLENFEKLKKEGKFIDLVSPSYGGLSANVEYELLTGGNMAFIPKGYVPFISLYNKEYSKLSPSIFKELRNNGYYTKIVFGKDYYNSDKVYYRLGVNEYQDVDDTQYYKGYYVSDEHLTDLIIESIENVKEPLFYITPTIQGHMPYNINKYDKYDISVTESQLEKEDTNKILSYTQGIYDADKQLGRLYDYIKKSDEETVIVFLGDHLPYLNNNNKDILQSLEYFNSDDEIKNLFRKYNTQALILTNYKVDDKEYEIMSPDYLLSYIINNMDIKISNYFKFIEKNRIKIKALNQFIVVDENNHIKSNNNINEMLKEIYNLRKDIQYYQFFDKRD